MAIGTGPKDQPRHRATAIGNRAWITLVRASNLKERVLRAVMPARMHIVPYSWPLAFDACPCDVHFCEYLGARGVREKSIFHFGSGGHHVVGLRNREERLENQILAITASPAEHARYLSLVVRAPALGRCYRVLFADVYDLAAAALPTFDLVTLFHLCEFTPAAGAGRRWDDAGVLRLFLSKLSPGGRLLFYAGSFGWPAAAPLVERLVADGALRFEETYQSLRVYRIGPA